MVKERIISTKVVVAEKAPCKSTSEMGEICCHDHSELPCCTKIEYWGGPTQEDAIKALDLELDDQGRNSDGEYVKITFAPRDKPCGLKKTIYDTSQGSCCEEVEPLGVDHERSIEVIADHSFGMIYVTGGKLPFRVQVSGHGFYVGDSDSSYRDAIVNGRVIMIKTAEACGTGSFLISDGCSTIRYGVRSTVGKWVGIRGSVEPTIKWRCPGWPYSPAFLVLKRVVDGVRQVVKVGRRVEVEHEKKTVTTEDLIEYGYVGIDLEIKYHKWRNIIWQGSPAKRREISVDVTLSNGWEVAYDYGDGCYNVLERELPQIDKYLGTGDNVAYFTLAGDAYEEWKC